MMKPETEIARIPWQGPEPGSGGFAAPTWRYTRWKTDGKTFRIAHLAEYENLTDILECARDFEPDEWLKVSMTEIIKAISTLGDMRLIDSSPEDYREGPKWRLVIYADRIVCYSRTDDRRIQWYPDENQWDNPDPLLPE